MQVMTDELWHRTVTRLISAYPSARNLDVNRVVDVYSKGLAGFDVEVLRETFGAVITEFPEHLPGLGVLINIARRIQSRKVQTRSTQLLLGEPRPSADVGKAWLARIEHILDTVKPPLGKTWTWEDQFSPDHGDARRGIVRKPFNLAEFCVPADPEMPRKPNEYRHIHQKRS